MSGSILSLAFRGKLCSESCHSPPICVTCFPIEQLSYVHPSSSTCHFPLAWCLLPKVDLGGKHAVVLFALASECIWLMVSLGRRLNRGRRLGLSCFCSISGSSPPKMTFSMWLSRSEFPNCFVPRARNSSAVTSTWFLEFLCPAHTYLNNFFDFTFLLRPWLLHADIWGRWV